MDQHAQDSKVQAVACSSLAMIALNSRESKTRFQETGVIKRIVAAMQNHMRDRQVQGMACYALMSSVNVDTRAEIEAEGAVQSIIAAATQHPFDFYVQVSCQRECFVALSSLISQRQCKQRRASLY
jgi:hypothetical protein